MGCNIPKPFLAQPYSVTPGHCREAVMGAGKPEAEDQVGYGVPLMLLLRMTIIKC